MRRDVTIAGVLLCAAAALAIADDELPDAAFLDFLGGAELESEEWTEFFDSLPLPDSDEDTPETNDDAD